MATEFTPSDYNREMSRRIRAICRRGGKLERSDILFFGEVADKIDYFDEQINTPHTAEFLEAVHLEAIHQRERWGSEYDTGKTDADWFWLVGYLAGKALHKPEKQVHHIITTAAALLNWHAAKTGTDTRMRPGIETPLSENERP